MANPIGARELLCFADRSSVCRSLVPLLTPDDSKAIALEVWKTAISGSEEARKPQCCRWLAAAFENAHGNLRFDRLQFRQVDELEIRVLRRHRVPDQCGLNRAELHVIRRLGNGGGKNGRAPSQRLPLC